MAKRTQTLAPAAPTAPKLSALGGVKTALAPAPQIDKFPVIIGSNLTLSYAASAMRLSLSGFRMQQVDLLGELLDHEPHTFSVVSKRVLGVAGGRLEIVPPKLPANDPAVPKATEIRDFIERQFNGIPKRTQTFASLLWALYYGLGAGENFYKRGMGWELTGIRPIHSRRLSFPQMGSWDLFVWDQGAQLLGPRPGDSTGIRIADYPGKFCVFSPQVRGDYPTREGVGRILITYMMIKRLIMRVSMQDFERFAKPWVIAYLSTSDKGRDFPAAADANAKADAEAVMAGIGAGSLAGATLPDSVRLEMLRAATTLSQEHFLDYLDGGISKAAVGQTFTTQPGKFGSKGMGETGKADALQLDRYDATCFADMLRDDLILPLVRLNFPGCEELAPRVLIHVEELPNATTVIGIAKDAAAINMPVDADALADKIGVTLIPNTTGEPRRLRPLALEPIEADDEEDEEEESGDGATGTKPPPSSGELPADDEDDDPPDA